MARNRSEKYWFVCIVFRTVVGIIPLFSLGEKGSLIDLIGEIIFLFYARIENLGLKTRVLEK